MTLFGFFFELISHDMEAIVPKYDSVGIELCAEGHMNAKVCEQKIFDKKTTGLTIENISIDSHRPI